MAKKNNEIDVLVERLTNLIQQNKTEHEHILKRFEEVFNEHEITIKSIDDRLKIIEFWKVDFVARFSIYSAIALFMGSMISNIVIYIITKYI